MEPNSKTVCKQSMRTACHVKAATAAMATGSEAKFLPEVVRKVCNDCCADAADPSACEDFCDEVALQLYREWLAKFRGIRLR